LIAKTEIKVRFNEADPLGIVWHGHYVGYMEAGREHFGDIYKITYLDIFKHGFVVPIVNVQCNYKKSLKYGDKVLIETELIPVKPAKIIFDYRLYNPATGDMVAEGQTTQVFLEKDTNVLQLTHPRFYLDFLKDNHIIL